MKNLKKLLSALALMGIANLAQAASVSLDPASQPATIGNTVSFDVLFSDFTGTVVSGNFNLNYDATRLTFSSFNAGDMDASFSPVTDSGSVLGISFAGPLSSASGTLGTVNFTATGLGTAILSTSVGTPGFYDGSSYFVPAFSGASATISAVPAPAALWLMASGLSLLGVGLRRDHA